MTARRSSLPDFVAPMLARLGQPFDSDDHYFDVKWDGYRCIVRVDHDGHRLVSRRRWDMTAIFPELDFVRALPPGTILDGEVIALRDGMPSFQQLQQRGQARSPRRVQQLLEKIPTELVVFDLLYFDFTPHLDAPFTERQERLHEVAALTPRLIVSEGVVGAGKAFFEEAIEQGLEGVVAKRLTSPYQPGKRTGAWTKIKAVKSYYCLILGFLPGGKDDFKSLLVATNDGEQLRYAGRVGTGFSAAVRRKVNRELRARLTDAPLVPCPEQGVWIEPGLYCTVQCMEKTDQDLLRAPVFQQLVDA
jgi:DNA ligase D-like protein (predicted ligase)